MLTLIDGSGSIAVSVNSNAITCFLNTITARLVRDFTERTTFCTSGGWRSRLPGVKQLLGRVSGFLAKGAAGTDPSDYMEGTAAQPYVLTFDTGCSFTFAGHAQEVGAGVVKQTNESSFTLDFESDGPVTTAWVVA